MKQYIIDAFTDTIFSGNQAAVCILDEWLSDEIMLSIAKENNLSETAFAIKQVTKDNVNAIHYKLRWWHRFAAGFDRADALRPFTDFSEHLSRVEPNRSRHQRSAHRVRLVPLADVVAH